MSSLSVESTFLVGDPLYIQINTDWFNARYSVELFLDGTNVGYLLNRSQYTYTTWTPPLDDIGSLIPNSDTVQVGFYVTIYDANGFTVESFGTPYYTITMPAYRLTVKDITTFKDLLDKNGNRLNWTQIVQNRTDVFPALYTNQVGNLYGASIRSVSFTVNGRQYVGSYDGIEGYYSARVGKIATSGSVGVSVTVTDSRGRTGTSTIYITVTAYNPPAIDNVRLYRCDSAGVESDTGAYLYAYADVAYTQIGTNAVKLYAGYKLLSANRYTEFEITPGEANIISAGLSSESNYDIVLYAEDLFERSDQQHDVITTEMITLHMKNGGKAVGIGMYVTNEADESVHVAWDTRVYGKMTANSIQVGDQVLTESDVQRLLSLLS